MKRILRVIGKALYLREDGSFTRNLDEALNFPDMLTAIEFCREHGCRGLELLFWPEGAPNPVTVPMGHVA